MGYRVYLAGAFLEHLEDVALERPDTSLHQDGSLSHSDDELLFLGRPGASLPLRTFLRVSLRASRRHLEHELESVVKQPRALEGRLAEQL